MYVIDIGIAVGVLAIDLLPLVREESILEDTGVDTAVPDCDDDRFGL